MIKPNQNILYKQKVKQASKSRQIDQYKRSAQRSASHKFVFHDCTTGTHHNKQQRANENLDRRMNRLASTSLDTKKQAIQTKAFTENIKNSSTKIDIMEFNQLSQNNLTSKQKSNKKQQHSCENYFLRKTILLLFTFFNKSPFLWDLDRLSYRQLLAILKELKYIRHSDEQSYTDSARQVSEELKKCYYLYISISRGKTFKLVNLIIALCCLENLSFDANLIQEIIQELSQQMNNNKVESNFSDSKYIFFTKKQPLTFQNDILHPTPKQIARIQHSLKCFRDTKMMSNFVCQDQNLDHAEEQPPLLSKKSKQLASNKRQKILEQIKKSKPQIQQIQLHHILSYKENVATRAEVESKWTRKQPVNADKLSKKKSQRDVKFKNYKFKQSNRLLKNQQSQPQDCNQHQLKIKFQTENNQQICKKMEIVDELEWQEIPKPLEDITFENELLNLKDDLKIPVSLGLSQKAVTEQSEKQKKRREYLQLPILYVDVNIEEGKKERIVIYEGDKALDLAVQFCKKHGLAEETVSQLEMMLEQQIGSVLTKIQEAIEQDCSYLY